MRDLTRLCGLLWLAMAPCLLSGCHFREALAEIYVAQRLNAGAAALSAGNGAKAVEELEEVVAREPEHPEAQELLGQAYGLAKQHAKALPFLEKRDASDRSVQDWFMLADVYDHLGRHDEAERAGAQAVEAARSTASLPVAQNNLGYMLANRGRKLDEALRLVEEADRAMPGQGFIVDSLAWVRYRRGEYEAALRDIERACRLSPANTELRYHQGMILLGLGRKQEAVEALGQALELDPENAEATAALNGLGVDPRQYARQAGGWQQQWRKAQQVISATGDMLKRGLF